MEKTWDDFWTSGKVTDYLACKHVLADDEQGYCREKNRKYVTFGHRDGQGFDCHAH